MKKMIPPALFSLAGLFITAFLFFVIRQALVNREIEREWNIIPDSVPQLETTSRLEIIPLYEEARTGDDFIGGHGVSYLIRTDSFAVLMDVGDNPSQSALAPYMQNMQALGISTDAIDAVVISHPHPDHIGGVDAWKEHTISFGEAFSDLQNTPLYIPTQMKIQDAAVSGAPTPLSPDTATSGAISYPEVFPLSLFEPKGIEQALVVNVAGEGLVLITGCGHPTIEKLITRAEVLYDLPVVGIAGGLHYEGFSFDDVQPHIQFLASRDLRLVALSPHDSSPAALDAFQSAFTDHYYTLQVGESIQFPNRGNDE